MSSSIKISIGSQLLKLLDAHGNMVREYPVSTSRFGAGELSGSHCTPRGQHIIRACIGAGQPVNAVFVGRRPTGEIWSELLAATQPDRDWILTRILWLSGCERGRNRLGPVDTMRRYIYIHGAPDSAPMGVPASIGCIRMHSLAIVDLYGRVVPGTPVSIDE